MNTRYKLAIAGGIIAAISVTAASFAASPSIVPTGTASPSASSPAGRMFDKDQFKPVHSESEMIDAQGKLVTMIMDAGTVTNVSSTSLTIKRLDGQSVTVTPDANTRIGRNHARATLGDIKSGDRAMIMQLRQNGSTQVIGIRAADPSFQPKGFGRGFGSGFGHGFGRGFGGFGRHMWRDAPPAPGGA